MVPVHRRRAVKVAGLREADEEVLAPTDDAFALLAAGMLESLFHPSAIEHLIDLAETHITRASVVAVPLLAFASVATGARVLARGCEVSSSSRTQRASVVSKTISGSSSPRPVARHFALFFVRLTAVIDEGTYRAVDVVEWQRTGARLVARARACA